MYGLRTYLGQNVRIEISRVSLKQKFLTFHRLAKHFVESHSTINDNGVKRKEKPKYYENLQSQEI